VHSRQFGDRRLNLSKFFKVAVEVTLLLQNLHIAALRIDEFLSPHSWILFTGHFSETPLWTLESLCLDGHFGGGHLEGVPGGFSGLGGVDCADREEQVVFLATGSPSGTFSKGFPHP